MSSTYTADWSDDDIDSVIAFCVALDIADPTTPIGVWMHESNCRTTAHNANGDASGICQFMPATLHALGYDPTDTDLSKFRALSPSDQISWAAKFYAPASGKLNTPAAVYLWTFLPAQIGLASNPAAVVCGRDGPYAWAYNANGSAFDLIAKGEILVSDMTREANASAATARGLELMARIKSRADTQPEITRPV